MIDFVLYFNQEYIFTKTHVQLLYELSTDYIWLFTIS